VQDHHGTITVESHAGQGATFIVALPVMLRVEPSRQGSYQLLRPALTASQDQGVC
jgi:nitrogen-specific signal transduction histidine kinase